MRRCPLLLTLAALAMAWMPAAGAEVVVLRNATVVDVDAGTARPHQTLHLSNGSIARVVADGSVGDPQGARVIDLAGKYVLPGLWDMHVHPDSETDLEQLVANGVTSVRIMAGEPRHLAWRGRIELGETAGPRLFIAGPIIEGRPPPQMANVIDTENRRLLDTREDAVAEARAQHAAGFDYLKVYNNLPAEAYAGLISEGNRLGMRVVGHVPFEVGLSGVLAAGQASIEHLRGYVEPLVPADAPVQPGADYRSRTLAWEYADLGRMAPLVAASRTAGIWETPTLSTRLYTAPTAEVMRYLATPEAIYLGRWARNGLPDRRRIAWLSNFSEQDWVRAERGHAKQDALLLALHRGGVPFLAGTDVGPWGFTLHGELAHLVDVGLTPQQALVTATTNPARFAGVTDRAGRVAEGYQADLLVLDANPLENIANTRRIVTVVVRGNVLDRAALDAMLARVRARLAEAEATRR